MAPARVLAREPQHQLPHLNREPQPSTPSGRLAPLPAHEDAMPTQERPRRNQKHARRRPRQVTGGGCQQRPISRAKLRPGDLPTAKKRRPQILAPFSPQSVRFLHRSAVSGTRARASNIGKDLAASPSRARAPKQNHTVPNPPRAREGPLDTAEARTSDRSFDTLQG